MISHLILKHLLTQKIPNNQRHKLTSSVLLKIPEGSQQSLVAFIALIILSVQQDLLGISEQTGDSGV